jgi:hypothetical protein
MANFIITYDLNGPHPSHKEMDDRILALGAAFVRGRILETVWYVAGPTTSVDLRNYLLPILDREDSIFVAETLNAAWMNLLVDSAALKTIFEAQPLSIAA